MPYIFARYLTLLFFHIKISANQHACYSCTKIQPFNKIFAHNTRILSSFFIKTSIFCLIFRKILQKSDFFY